MILFKNGVWTSSHWTSTAWWLSCWNTCEIKSEAKDEKGIIFGNLWNDFDINLPTNPGLLAYLAPFCLRLLTYFGNSSRVTAIHWLTRCFGHCLQCFTPSRRNMRVREVVHRMKRWKHSVMHFHYSKRKAEVEQFLQFQVPSFRR